MERPDVTTIEQVSTDYPSRPEHRGHTVSISGWNSEYVMLLIESDDYIEEAIISPAQLRRLADRAEQEAPGW